MQENSIQECQSQKNIDNYRHIMLDPEKSVTKGRRKRIKGHFEKKKQSTTKINKDKGVWFHNTKQTHYMIYV